MMAKLENQWTLTFYKLRQESNFEISEGAQKESLVKNETTFL